jgi:hypothetical protein
LGFQKGVFRIGKNVWDMYRARFQQRARSHRSAAGLDGMFL